MAIGPGHAQRADEMGGAALRAQFVVHTGHGDREILGRPGPARRVDAGRAAQAIHTQPAVVGNCRQAAQCGRRERLQPGVADEGRFRLVRFRQTQFAGRYHVQPMRVQQFGQFHHLAGIMRGQHQPAPIKLAQQLPHRPTAFSWAANTSLQPMRARRSRRSRASSSNGSPSAVPCTSTIPAWLVSTKLASVPAALSSI